MKWILSQTVAQLSNSFEFFLIMNNQIKDYLHRALATLAGFCSTGGVDALFSQQGAARAHAAALASRLQEAAAALTSSAMLSQSALFIKGLNQLHRLFPF